MKYSIDYTHQFKRELKRCLKRGCNEKALWDVVNLLENNGWLPSKYHPHKLVGKYKDYWECHITPNWLLVWDQNDDKLTLMLLHTGSHSDLFK